MKQIYIYIALCSFILGSFSLKAQVTTQDNIQIKQLKISKDENTVHLNMILNLDNLKLPSSNMLVLTPALRSKDGSHIRRFRPIVIMGASRSRTIERATDFNGYRFADTPQVMKRRHNGTSEFIPLTLTTPYEGWLRGGQLVFFEDKSVCAYEEVRKAEYIALTPVLPLLIEPVFRYTYVTPPVEEVKQRSETYSAHLNFQVGKHVILRDFKNNAEVLNKVDQVINEIRNDKNLSITNFEITGYASPEGNEQSNMILSENRAEAFVAYLTDRYNIAPSTIRTNWEGEDWKGLREVVTLSNIPNKTEILTVLNEPANAQRKAKLKQLNGGRTYRMLLDEYYPQLRRNDYTIAFIAKKFSIEEAQELIKTKPQYLSLNEMFLVANTYPKNSREFKDVFDIAVRLYPNDPIAQLNTGVLELENGAVDNAIERLQKVNMPEAWNNLGIAYASKKEYTKALKYFKRAATAGNKTASQNMLQLQEYMEAQ